MYTSEKYSKWFCARTVTFVSKTSLRPSLKNMKKPILFHYRARCTHTEGGHQMHPEESRVGKSKVEILQPACSCIHGGRSFAPWQRQKHRTAWVKPFIYMYDCFLQCCLVTVPGFQSSIVGCWDGKGQNFKCLLLGFYFLLYSTTGYWTLSTTWDQSKLKASIKYLITLSISIDVFKLQLCNNLAVWTSGEEVSRNHASTTPATRLSLIHISEPTRPY